jgi:hypothetical protein
LPTPGVNAPNVAGVPRVSDSVAGTLPPAPPPVSPSVALVDSGSRHTLRPNVAAYRYFPSPLSLTSITGIRGSPPAPTLYQ